MKCFFTACAYNYYPSAKALCESVKEIYPDSYFGFFLVDKENEYTIQMIEKDGFDEVFTFDDIKGEVSIPIEAWIFSHNVMELSTAVKPFVLSMLLERKNIDSVVFIDPDAYMFNAIDSVFSSLEKFSIILTPHMNKPAVKELEHREFGPMMHGVFNLGFFAVKKTTEGIEFAKWWKERLKKYCIVERARGMFTDQKWINLVPCLFNDYYVLKDNTLNVATWNTFQRTTTGEIPNNIKIDGKPLGFYHFAGIYSGRHEKVTKEFSLNPDKLIELQKWYEDRIQNDRNNKSLSGEWGYDRYENGEKISQEHRQFYRDHEVLIEKFSNPFNSNSKANYYNHITNIEKKRHNSVVKKVDYDKVASELENIKKSWLYRLIKFNLK